MQPVGTVLRPGLNLGPWQGECRVLTTGPLGQSSVSIISMMTEKGQSWAGVVKARYLPIILYFQPTGYHLQQSLTPQTQRNKIYSTL